MKFSDFICRDAILANMAAVDKEGAIREMVQSLVDAKRVNAAEFESIVKAILKREELGSTGIGRGVAVPHTKHPSVDKIVGTVAVSPSGVDFASLDGEPVHLFFLLISEGGSEHLLALEYISRQLRHDTFYGLLKKAESPEDIAVLLNEADNNQFGD